jgi:hypothetical protein
MRIVLILLLISGAAQVSEAHTIAGEEGVFHSLGHQVFALHHLPFTMLMLVVGVTLLRQCQRRRRP